EAFAESARAQYGILDRMRRRKLLAAAILLAASLTTVCIGPFPRPLIVVPAFALAWLLVSRRATRLKAACAVVFTSVLLLLWYDVLWTAARNSSIATGELVYQLYDANCTFPFPGYRYPHEIIQLRKGYPDADLDALLWCRN